MVRYAFELEFGKSYLFKIYRYKPPIVYFFDWPGLKNAPDF